MILSFLATATSPQRQNIHDRRTGPHNPPCHLSRIVKSAPANSEESLAGEIETVYEEAAECVGITGRGSLNERTGWRNV